MASFHHIKIENSGKRGNIDVKFCFDKDDNTSSCGVSEVNRYNRTRENSVPQRQLVSNGYEQEASRYPPREKDSESDYETEVDSICCSSKADLNEYQTLKSDAAELLNSSMSKHDEKAKYKHLQVRMKKRDKYKRNIQQKITEYFNQNKIIKTIPKTMLRGPGYYFTYGLGSYFDRENLDPTPRSRDQMRSESGRFQSFHNYMGNGNPWSLASDGFFHAHSEGQATTRCVECRVSHSTWTHNDDVPSVHRRISPNCTFLNRNSSITQQNDVRESVTYRTNTTERPAERSATASGVFEAQRYINLANTKLTREYGNQERPVEAGRQQESNRAFGRSINLNNDNIQPNQESNSACITQASGYQLSLAHRLISQESSTQPSSNRQLWMRNLPNTSAGLPQTPSPFDKTVSNPRYPDQSRLDARMRSFLDWQGSPEELAKAGFFFAGIPDCVRCFCCGVSLRNWAAEYDPMEEHDCEYVRAVKGERYIAEAQRRISENMAGQQEQLSGRAEMITDTETFEVVVVMQEMGISADHAREAVLAVRQQTGEYQVTPDQALNWFLDNERRLEHASTAEEIQSQAVATSFQSSLSSAAKIKAAAGKNQEAVSAEMENQKLKELTSCKICKEKTMCITFLPCGHLLCCERCAVQVKRCPTCREKIAGTVKTFMPL